MAKTKLSGSPAIVGGLIVGRGPSEGGKGAVGSTGTPAWIKGIRTATRNVTPTGNSVAAGAVDEQSVTITGVAVGDLILAIPPVNLETGLVPAVPYISAANTVKVRNSNPTGSPITTAVKAWTFIWIQLA